MKTPLNSIVDNIVDNTPNRLVIKDDDCTKTLKKYSNRTIEELPNLIIFPSINDSKDDIGEQKLYDFYPKENKYILKENKYILKTGNLAGFVRLDNNLDLRIKSRFGGENDFFLQYMICKVFNVNIANLAYNASKSDELSTMALLLLPAYILKAYRKGLFRSYKRFKRNDDKVRGAIDVARHIRQNPLFNGKIAYTSREYSYDNHITQLVRHAVEYARTLEVGKVLLSHNQELRKALQELEYATPSYASQRRNEVINTNKKPFSHPYYSEYADLQKLCLMILKKKGIDFTSNSNENVQGILFDLSWLWEEYLWSVLKDTDFKHPNNRKFQDGIKAFEIEFPQCEIPYSEINKEIYPDFYNDKMIIDAKYKEMTKKKDDKIQINVARKDIYQMISYMHLQKSNLGMLVYPFLYDNNIIDYIFKGGKIQAYGFRISKSGDLKDFCKEMVEQENNFKDYLSQNFN